MKKQLARRCVYVACCLMVAGCSSIYNSKSAAHHISGLVDVKIGDEERGVESLAKATARTPGNAEYKVDYLRKRDDLVRAMFKEADELRADGKAIKAREVYEHIIKLDTGNIKAQDALVAIKHDIRFERLLIDGEAFLEQGKFDFAIDRANQVLEDFPQNRRAIKLKDGAYDAKAESDAKKSKERLSKTILETPVTLQFSDMSIKSVFEAMSKATGLNILFDKDVKQESKVTLFVKDVSVSDALDLVLLQNQLAKRVLNGNTMLIYPATAAKSTEYEELVIKTFQITNADVKYVSNMLKSMLKLKEMSADEKTGILVVRDTPESLRMAERLIAAHDVPDPEIMLEVEVLEVTDNRTSNLGLQPPTSVTISTPGGSGSGTGASAVGSSLTLSQLRNLSRGDLLVSSLSTTLNFQLQDVDSKLLASPRIRARNKETAKIMIGDRVPTVTNSVTPVATGSPVVTGNVSYQDVGLKLEFKSQVYSNSEVGIELALEVSNIAGVFTDTNGGRSYQIGTRNASTNLRLKDGETQILGGLINDEDRNTASKIPGLGHLPIIGALFGNNNGSSVKSEIILAVTPRIVRNLAMRTPEVKNIFSGTYNVIKEKPILAEPVGELRVSGTFGGAEQGGATSGSGSSSVLFNPAPVKAPSTTTTPTGSGFGQNRGPAPLGAPPPMIQRTPGSPLN